MSITFDDFQRMRETMSPKELAEWMKRPEVARDLVTLLKRASMVGTQEAEQARMLGDQQLREWCGSHPDPGYTAGAVISIREGIRKTLAMIVRVERRDGMRQYHLQVGDEILTPHPSLVETPPAVLVMAGEISDSSKEDESNES